MSDSTGETAPVLEVSNLRTHIHTEDRTIRAVDGVSFDVAPGETVCIVGESGSGKSVTVESITGLVPQPPATIEGGTIEFDGARVDPTTPGEVRPLRGERIAHIFQNPMQSLNPVYTVGEQVIETIEIHGSATDSSPRDRAIELLRQVGIPDAASRLSDYPHEFSGGMAQRVALAIALAGDPSLLIADEPTTAVDVTVQARLIDLLTDLTGGGMALLLITHDFRVVSSLADRVLVMYGGTIVEQGPTADLFACPSHPYTQTLFESYERLHHRTERHARDDLPANGCRFRHDCPHAIEACSAGEQPPYHAVNEDGTHTVSCVHFAEERDASEITTHGSVVGPIGGEHQ